MILSDGDEVQFETHVMEVAQDTYVPSGIYGDNNYGGNGWLYVKKTSGNFVRKALLQFDRSAVSGSAKSATLKLYVTSSGDTATQANSAITEFSNAWTEFGVTNNNRPSLGADIAFFNSKPAGNWIEIDVTDYFNSQAGESQISFGVRNLNGGGSSFWSFSSREGGNPSELVVIE